jgi:quinoprotein dehydrogenase-associated probable ABC transporter substrate-binding protein
MITGVGDVQSQEWEVVVCADPDARPFSHNDETGFENRIATLLAEEMGAELSFYWIAQSRTLMTDALRQGECDVIIGLADGDDTALTTIAYYRSPFVFVYRTDEDYDITTFDDPVLRQLRIGVQPPNSPPHQAIARRGLAENIILEAPNLVGLVIDPFEPIVAAVAENEIDVAVMWGPAAGHYATRQVVGLTVTPVPLFEPPFTPMYVNMVAGVRFGDEFLRDLIDVALVNRWDDIQSIMADTGIITLPLAPPILTLEPR